MTVGNRSYRSRSSSDSRLMKTTLARFSRPDSGPATGLTVSRVTRGTARRR